MIEKTNDERFAFIAGGFQDFPNTTDVAGAIVVSKAIDLSTKKFVNGSLVDLDESDIAVALALEFEALAIDYESRVDKMLDDKAREYGYKLGISSAVTYADEPSVLKFQVEGEAFRKWRSMVYAKGYEIMAAAAAAEIWPTFEEVAEQLPVFELDAS
jgi:hypothetical protein